MSPKKSASPQMSIQTLSCFVFYFSLVRATSEFLAIPSERSLGIRVRFLAAHLAERAKAHKSERVSLRFASRLAGMETANQFRDKALREIDFLISQGPGNNNTKTSASCRSVVGLLQSSQTKPPQFRQWCRLPTWHKASYSQIAKWEIKLIPSDGILAGVFLVLGISCSDLLWALWPPC